jgi:D-amino peptidase
MKIFISVDLEGISGVFAEDQTTVGTAPYEEVRRYMQADVDTVIEACLAGGATDIVVADGHAGGANLRFDSLPESVRLVSGSPSPRSMMQGVDASFEAAMLIGYHARVGTAEAVLEHTYSYDVAQVSVGNREVGEIAINAAVAGTFGVPVVLVSGDDKAVAEAKRDLPGVEGAIVKDGVARTAACLLSPSKARARLAEGVQRALASRGHWPSPLQLPEGPLRVSFTRTGICDHVCRHPGVRRLDARTIEITGDDYLAVYGALLTCLALAHGASL